MTTVASYDFTPTVDTALLAGYDFDWAGTGGQGATASTFDFDLLVQPVDAGVGAAGRGMQLAESAPNDQLRHLSSWGVVQASEGGDLTLKADHHYVVMLLASSVRTADGCTSAEIVRGELTIQYAGMTP